MSGESSHLVSQKPCFLYVCLSEEIISGGHLLEKSRESLLSVEVSQYIRLVSCSCSYKVRINESDVADSDRICGIRVKINGDDNSLFSVVGVYLPCINQGVDRYREHLLELEHLMSE